MYTLSIFFIDWARFFIIFPRLYKLYPRQCRHWTVALLQHVASALMRMTLLLLIQWFSSYGAGRCWGTKCNEWMNRCAPIFLSQMHVDLTQMRFSEVLQIFISLWHCPSMFVGVIQNENAFVFMIDVHQFHGYFSALSNIHPQVRMFCCNWGY